MKARLWMSAILLAMLPWRSLAPAAEVHVAPDGDDANPGTTERPVAALERARDLLRQAPAGHVRRMLLKGGDYYGVHLTLGPKDSGLVIEGVPGERPVLYGGRRVEGWKAAEGGLWVAPLPGVKEGAWDFRTLVVNDETRPRARLPEEGRFTHLNRYTASLRPGEAPPPTEQDLTTLKFKPEEILPGLDVKSAEMTIYHEWNESLVGVKAIDFQTNTLTFSSKATYPPGSFNNQTYVVWNVREGLRKPGQWRLDRTDGALVYWPLPGETMETLHAVAPTGESIIRLEGTAEAPVERVTLSGLSLRCTTAPLAPGGWAAGRYAGAIHAVHTRGCRFRNLDIGHVGGQGIYLHESDEPSVERCEVHDTGAGGIYLVGRGGTVSDCRVHHVGEASPSAIGIRVIGESHVVRHNDVHDTSYCGIEGGSSGAVIENNRIWDFMQVLHDGGAIYTSYNGRANPCRDVVIRGNLVFYRGGSARPRTRAYYLDEQSWNCILEKNVAVNTRAPCFLHITTDCIVRNNVFVDEGDIQLWWNNSKGVRFERNIVLASGLVDHPGSPTEWKDNLFFSLADKYQGVPQAQSGADPRLRDWKRGDYAFGDDSPARALGIEPVDVRGAGPREEDPPR